MTELLNTVDASSAPTVEHQQACLQLLRDIFEVSTALGTRTYIWGGMVMDILCGEFLRIHHDIDAFTLNLLDIKVEMAALFAERGYRTSYIDAYDMLRVEKDALHAAFNRLEIDGATALWRHVGDQGTVCFPVDWLDSTPRCFYDACAYTSGLQFEYAIKSNIHLLNLEWQLRDKDRCALNFLTAKLARKEIDVAEMLAEIWNSTPYWIQRGYPEYAKRIVPE
jgi:hypothetical protein